MYVKDRVTCMHIVSTPAIPHAYIRTFHDASICNVTKSTDGAKFVMHLN